MCVCVCVCKQINEVDIRWRAPQKHFYLRGETNSNYTDIIHIVNYKMQCIYLYAIRNGMPFAVAIIKMDMFAFARNEQALRNIMGRDSVLSPK